MHISEIFSPSLFSGLAPLLTTLVIYIVFLYFNKGNLSSN